MDASAASEMDPSEWPGQNLLGKILMELRREFSGIKNPVAKTALQLVKGDITKGAGEGG